MSQNNNEHENGLEITHKNVNLSINGIPVSVGEGTTILEAARKVNVKIPTLCDHPDLCRRAQCRICVVECDGRAKLVAACANDVWEGVNIVTSNARLIGIRRTILELILANHPQECLSCVRNTTCELQKLAAEFGIRTSPFSRDASVLAVEQRHPVTDSETLVRDMRKCVKCNRCVEVCQERQTVRAINSVRRSTRYEICTPYAQALSEGPCICCGKCAEVCPVGAICEKDESAGVWAALNARALSDNEREVQVSFYPAIAEALNAEFSLPSGTITSGKIITALGLLGFGNVYNAGHFADMTIALERAELAGRIKTETALPMISCSLPGFRKFMDEFYPDLLHHLPSSASPADNFIAHAKGQLAGKPKKTFVSIVPGIGYKFRARQPERNGLQTDANQNEIILSARELARMIRIAGINISDLNESGFPGLDAGSPQYHYTTKKGAANIETAFWEIYKAYDDGFDDSNRPNDFTKKRNEIKETELNLDGSKVKVLIADGLAAARIVMDSIRKGECTAVLAGIRE